MLIERNTSRLKRAFDDGCVTPDQMNTAREPGHWTHQWREVLTFTISTEDDNKLAITTQPDEGCDGRADIGPFAVIKELDSVNQANRLHTVGLTTVFAKSMQQHREGAARRSRE